MIQGTANLRASHGIVTTDWDPPDAEVAQVSRQLIDETVAAWNAQHADLDRARSIAVALEQENAELRRYVEGASAVIRLVTDLMNGDVDDDELLRQSLSASLPGDVVGQEGLPLGDQWADSPIPDDWREDE